VAIEDLAAESAWETKLKALMPEDGAQVPLPTGVKQD